MVGRLVHELGTRYFINSLSSMLDNYLDMLIIKNGYSVDIADAKFGPVSASVLAKYYATGALLDSRDPERDAILKHNYEVLNTQWESYPILSIIDTSRNNLMNLIETLPPDSKYTLTAPIINSRELAFFTILILKRLDIEWDLSGCALPLVKFIHDIWSSSRKKRFHRKYIEVCDNCLVERSVTPTGYIKLDLGKVVSERNFIEHHNCLPYEFGKVDLLKLSPNGEPQGEFAEVFNKCWDILKVIDVHIPCIEDHLVFRRIN